MKQNSSHVKGLSECSFVIEKEKRTRKMDTGKEAKRKKYFEIVTHDDDKRRWSQLRCSLK